jgi:hypothetical protein
VDLLESMFLVSCGPRNSIAAIKSNYARFPTSVNSETSHHDVEDVMDPIGINFLFLNECREDIVQDAKDSCC